MEGLGRELGRWVNFRREGFGNGGWRATNFTGGLSCSCELRTARGRRRARRGKIRGPRARRARGRMATAGRSRSPGSSGPPRCRSSPPPQPAPRAALLWFRGGLGGDGLRERRVATSRGLEARVAEFAAKQVGAMGDDRFPPWASTSGRMRQLRQKPAPSRDHQWRRPRVSDPEAGGHGENLAGLRVDESHGPWLPFKFQRQPTSSTSLTTSATRLRSG